MSRTVMCGALLLGAGLAIGVAPPVGASAAGPWLAMDITPNRADVVTAYGYPVGQTATLYADYDGDGNPEYSVQKTIADPTAFTLGVGVLHAGSIAFVKTEGVGIDMTAAQLSVFAVDAPTDVVRGAATADAIVVVNIGKTAGGSLTRTTTAAGDGGWQVDFTGTADIRPATWVTATVSDANGNETRYSAQCPDQERPTIRITSPSVAFALGASARLGYRGSDNVGVVNYDARWKSARYDSGFGDWHYPRGWQKTTNRSITLNGLRPGTEYCLSVRARDAFGNVSDWARPWCVARPLDDTSLAATSVWTRHADRRYYLRTYASTGTQGGRLTRTGAQVDRLAVVATRCPTCGSITVLISGKAVASWTLKAATTQRKVILLSERFSFREGTVVIKVTSAHKPVQIDGLGIRRV